MSASVAASTRAVRGSVGRQSPSLSRRLLHDSGVNGSPSSLAKYVESNRETSSGNRCEALHRYFSDPDRPIATSDRNSADASVAVHKALAQAAIDAVDAAMKEE